MPERGVASGTGVSSGEHQHVNGEHQHVNGGVASGTVVNGGTQFVYSGAITTNTVLNSCGRIDEANYTYGSGGTTSLNSTNDVLTISQG